MCDGKTGKIIDIIEDRKLNSLLKYFSYFTYKARSEVKLIVIDMYSPYISFQKSLSKCKDYYRQISSYPTYLYIIKQN